jgi:hypothetical protein
MEANTFMMPLMGGKMVLRSTGEEVEIIDSEIKERGARSDEDWVTYIDSQGKEHIKEHLNLQLDFKSVINGTWNKVFDFAKVNKMPTTRNCRIFEVAKELYRNGDKWYSITDAVNDATMLVDKVGIDTE